MYLTALGLSCGMWGLVLWLESNSGPLLWELRVLATGSPGKSPNFFLAALGLWSCVWIFSSGGKRGLLSSGSAWCTSSSMHCGHCWGPRCAATGALTGLVASRHVEAPLTRDQTGVPALAGGFLTTGPPGKSPKKVFLEVPNSFRKQVKGHYQFAENLR